MTKYIARLVALIICCLCLFSACANDKPKNDYSSTWATDEKGNNILTSKQSTTVFPDFLPADVEYNDTSVSVKSLKAYQSSSSFEYTAYIVVELDVSNLTESQLHWLRKSDLSVSAFITNEANGQDFDRMPVLGNLLLTDEKIIQFVLHSSFYDENRYDFAGSEITLCVDIEQEETYPYVNDEGNTTELNKKNCVQYSTTLPDTLADVETIPKPLYDYVVDWLEEWSKKN